jgi:hypothetical protein
MRLQTSLGVLICCCAALAACTAAAPKRPDATVTTPAVGRPPPPASAQAALSSEAFTPYAALGLSSNDGLAPGESGPTLAAACMSAEGYPGAAAAAQVDSDLGRSNDLSFSEGPDGSWGYLGAADAQQYGFLLGPPDLSGLGLYDGPVPSFGSLPRAEQAAANRCYTILGNFASAMNGPLAGIFTLTNDIDTDVQNDAAVQNATRAWSGCMAKNGYSFSQPQGMIFQELTATTGQRASPSTRVSASAQRAQLAAAVTDVGCTQTSDLAGIYFAVQASYEQQLVTANQQALGAAVSQYRAAYANDLSNLAALLHTAKAQPFPQSRHPRLRGHAG